MNKKWYFISFLLLCLWTNKVFPKIVEELEIKKDDITLVQTSIGYTTLIELPSRPVRVVIGDQNSFLVEFVGENLAVKPLTGFAKTNIFIFTKDRKYQCTLVSGSREKLQYIVRLKKKDYVTYTLNQVRERKNISVTLSRYRKSLEYPCYEFTFWIQNKRKNKIKLDPKRINLSCGNMLLPISTLYLDSVEVEPNQKIKSQVIFHTTEGCSTLNLSLVVEGEEPLSIPFNWRITQ